MALREVADLEVWAGAKAEADPARRAIAATVFMVG